MSQLQHLLQDADPLRHERAGNANLERVRQTVLRTRISESRPPARVRLRWVGVLASIFVAALALLPQVGQLGTRMLLAAVRFEVRLAEDRARPGLLVEQIANSAELIFLHPEITASNDDIARSWVSRDGPDRFAVGVEFLPAGAERIRQATTGHVGRRVAILIDGRVLTAPILRSPVTESATINGNFTAAEAERIASGIASR